MVGSSECFRLRNGFFFLLFITFFFHCKSKRIFNVYCLPIHKYNINNVVVVFAVGRPSIRRPWIQEKRNSKWHENILLNYISIHRNILHRIIEPVNRLIIVYTTQLLFVPRPKDYIETGRIKARVGVRLRKRPNVMDKSTAIKPTESTRPGRKKK